MAHHVRLLTVHNEKEVVHVTVVVVVLTVCGRGTPGVLARVAAHRNNPERCVFHETQVVEEQRVRVEEAKGEAVTLDCMLYLF